jgi:hypothetical protein
MFNLVQSKKRNLFILFFSFLVVFFNQVKGWSQGDYPLEINYYKFINYHKNKFVFPGDSSEFERFFFKMDTIIQRGKGKLTIVHIGGSHIQADIYSGRTRERLQTFYPGMNGGRGSVFPYKISKTNTPRSYYADYTGEWVSCRNVEHQKNCNRGLTGITAITNDPSATLFIKLRNDSLVNYYFSKVRIFHSIDSSSFMPVLDSVKVVDVERNTELGYTIFHLDKEYTSFKLKFLKENFLEKKFELYGISLESEDPGIIYHSMGVNGASFPSFLRCNLLEKHLKALNPDLVILSLGTNDAYTTKFKPEFYKANYEKMISRIRKVAPQAAILNTVANDSYLFRRYPNRNTELAANVIYEVAHEKNCGVYNFYQVMGGFNSSSIWYKENLMVKDRIHFNREGYLLKGDLFFNAFIKAYDNHLRQLNK